MYKSYSAVMVLSTLISASLVRAESIVTPDTKSTIDETTGVKRPKFSPEMNITEVLPPKAPIDKENPEIYFSADEVENNQELSLITAAGNVEIIRNDITVKADKVIYNQKEDTITAIGNVIMLDETGNVVFSDYAELTDRMTKGEMENIKIIMADKNITE